MADSTNLLLPYIAANQAQKHVTHNDAIRLLDGLVQLSAKDRGLTAPPGSPADGARYLVASGATGAWADWDFNIAYYVDGAWMKLAPREGWLCWIEDENLLLAFDGSAWIVTTPTILQNLQRLGVNATADANNRLSVSSPASLFNHAGAGHRMTVNKAAAGDTGSVVFQTGFSGRAEFGLAGSDDFSVKTSPDGSAWNEALAFDRTTGRARFPSGMEHALTRAPVNGLVFTPGGDGVVSIWRADGTRPASPRTALISSVSGDVITLDAAVAGEFGRWTGYMENVAYLRVWNASKVPEEPAWIVASPSTSQLQVLDSATISGWSAGDTLRLGDPVPDVVASHCFALDISPMLQNVLGAVFPQAGTLLKVAAGGSAAYGDIGVTGSGAAGSFISVSSFADGAQNVASIAVPCTTLSPISNSNLLFIREGGAIDLGITSVTGVYA